MSWIEWILLQEGISVALMTSGLLLCIIGFVRRRKLSEHGEDKTSKLEQAESLFLLGSIQMGVASYMVLRGSRYAHIGIIILGIAYSVWGLARVRTRKGRAILLLGLFFALCGGAFSLV